MDLSQSYSQQPTQPSQSYSQQPTQPPYGQGVVDVWLKQYRTGTNVGKNMLLSWRGSFHFHTGNGEGSGGNYGISGSTIYFKYSNGVEDTGSIRYSNNKMIITYRGITLYE
jgi:hypothetical protein